MHVGMFPHLDPTSAPSLAVHEENFWPSFTDIMMVVVIIFLMSSTVAILHNWDLSRQVRETQVLEQEARSRAQAARERAQDLDVHQALMQMELEEVRTRSDILYRGLLGKTEQLEEQERALALTRRELSERQAQLVNVEQRHAQAQAEIRTERETSAQRERELLQVQQELAQLREESELHRRMSVKVEADQRQTREELARLQAEHDKVSEEYAALIRPARSPKGKAVVAVRYQKVNDQPSYMIRPPTGGDFKNVGQEEMHRTLSELKQEHGGELFVRIVIPTDSNLTYQDAWKFSIEMLERYDYYYQ